MRFGLIGVALLGLSGAAQAEDSPACAKFTNDFQYNACLAKQGPKAGVTHSTEAPASDAPAYGAPAGKAQSGLSVTRNKRGRMEAVFEIPPKK